MSYTTYELLWLFFAYSVLGWALGVAVESLKRKTFINAGVMSLPLCPVYGVASVVNAIFLKELKGAPVFLLLFMWFTSLHAAPPGRYSGQHQRHSRKRHLPVLRS